MIRHNRNSIAILTGNENKSQFAGLADDMMKFFGLGCRNVSKLYVPKGYDFSALIKELEPYRWQADHSKFRNNYDYYKSIYLVNKNPFYDNGFLLLTSSSRLNSPIGVVNFEEYSEFHNLDQRINEERKFIQCIVCTRNFGLNSVLPGQTQQPELWDYADGVDTMDFLQRLTFD